MALSGQCLHSHFLLVGLVCLGALPAKAEPTLFPQQEQSRNGERDAKQPLPRCGSLVRMCFATTVWRSLKRWSRRVVSF
jgi:hypothetical protein